jgi:FkbM family methyltransferase
MVSLLKKLFSQKYKRSIKENLGVPSLHWSLQNLKSIGYNPSFVIDIGAYEGYWTRDFLEVFPLAKVLMLEAQKSKEKYLAKISQDLSNVSYQISLLSSEDGKVLKFYENETASHVNVTDDTGSTVINSESLDSIIQRKQLQYPDFIKLDVQGYELEVLSGAEIALNNAEFCLLEVSFLDLGNEPLLSDVVHFMNNRGFQSYDICQFMRRPYDKALYQIDLLFIKKNSRFISCKRWH